MEKVSIIVPVYNVEEYLDRCINSILEQTYENLQIILVDDGATDSSGDICDKYSKLDLRITVIHKENGGLSDARNAGLDIVDGQYITFIDSDDYVSKDYIQKMYQMLYDNNADIAVCGEERFVENKDLSIKMIGSPYRKINGFRVMSAEEALANYMRQDLFDASSCGKLYKSLLFRNIRFPKGKTYEDVGTTYKVFLICNRVVYFDEGIYFYFQRTGSILHSEENTKRYWDGIEMAEQQLEAVSNISGDLKKAAECRCLSMLFHALIGAENNGDKELVDKAWKEIKKLRMNIIMDRRARKKTKLAAFLSLFGKRITAVTCSRYKS